MTIVVGILCDGGAVLAADKLATAGNIGQPITKIQPLGDKAVAAFSGNVEVGRVIAQNVSRLLGPYPESTDFFEFLKKLRTDILREFDEDRTRYGASGPLGLRLWKQMLCTCLLAAPFKDGPRLLQFDIEGVFRVVTDEPPFLCSGSGAANADPFISYLRTVFWPEGRPPLREGILAGYWTVKLAIELHTPQVGIDADAAVVEKQPKGWCVRTVPKPELAENDEFIEGARQALRDFRDRIFSKTPSERPSAPPTLKKS